MRKVARSARPQELKKVREKREPMENSKSCKAIFLQVWSFPPNGGGNLNGGKSLKFDSELIKTLS